MSVAHEAVQKPRDTNGSEHTGNRGQCKHQPNHDSRKIPRDGAVQNHKDFSVSEVVEQEVQTHRGKGDHDVKVKEKACPRSRLVLRHGSDDRDVLLSVGRVEQGKRAASPSKFTTELKAEESESSASNDSHTNHLGVMVSEK